MYVYVLLTQIARLLECAKEFAQQFLIVLKQNILVEVLQHRDCWSFMWFPTWNYCIRKNFLFCDAPSQTKAMTLKSAASSFCTASQASGNN